MPDTALTILKLCFLALLYLFLARVVRVVVLEMRPSAAVTDRAPAELPPNRRESRGRGNATKLRLVEPRSRRGETYELDDELTVGRGGGCGIVLADDHFVSTVHARVFRRGDEIHVEDLGSRNGTFVNGHRIETAAPLRRGDRVKFGSTVGEITR